MSNLIGAERYMRRCFELAKNGQGTVPPNPMVGAVIVHQGRIIGEGFHEYYGGNHAEVNAINSVKASDHKLLPESELYVNLEPCAHYGNTPPCADLVIEKRINKVFVANEDPNPLVTGKGLTKLRLAGCEVQSGILEKEGKMLNKRFFTFQTKKRPYIILKWAQSADGFFTKNDNEQHWITGELSKRLVHRWRSEEAAIMVGSNTVQIDNPQLTTRYWTGKNPVRIVLDEKLELPESKKVFSKEASTVVFNTKSELEKDNIRYYKMSFDENLLKEVLKKLYEQQLLSVMVEGGSKLLNHFIEQGLWDEARVLTGNICFREGIPAPKIKGEIVAKDQVGEDNLVLFEKQDNSR